MIKRILDPEEYKKVIEDIDELFIFENENQSHYYLKHSKDSITNNFANKYILAWDVFVWANFNGEKYDALIIFINDKSVKFNESIFTEFLWLSKNPKAGYKLFKEAIKFAKEKEFKYICMSRVYKHPNSYQVKNFYEKMDFKKDTQTFIGKL
jgi:hypothetical protein